MSIWLPRVKGARLCATPEAVRWTGSSRGQSSWQRPLLPLGVRPKPGWSGHIRQRVRACWRCGSWSVRQRQDGPKPQAGF